MQDIGMSVSVDNAITMITSQRCNSISTTANPNQILPIRLVEYGWPAHALTGIPLPYNLWPEILTKGACILN